MIKIAEIIYLITAVQLFGFAFMLIFKLNHKPGDKLLGLFAVLMSVYFTILWLCYNKNPLISFIPIRFFHPFIYLIGSFLYAYSCLITSKKQVFKRVYLWFFVPFLFLYLTDYILFAVYGSNSFTMQFYDHHPVTRIEYYFPITTIVIFTLLIYMRLRNFRSLLLNRFSSAENVDFKWLKTIFYSCLTSCSLAVSILLLSLSFDITFSMNNDTILRLLLGITLVFAGYAAYWQKDIFSNYHNLVIQELHFSETMKEKKRTAPHKKNSTADQNQKYDSAEMKKIFDRLEEIMIKEKFYLEPDLNLLILAQQLNISIQKLSFVINTFSKKNFFEYVNEFRIRDVKYNLMESKQLKKDIVTIGLECGFNSKSSFFRIFKDHTGSTPGQFHKEIHQYKQNKELAAF